MIQGTGLEVRLTSKEQTKMPRFRLESTGKSTTVHNLFFCSHTLCMNYVTNTFLLVSSSVRRKQVLRFVHGQGQKREQKPTTKKFVGFRNHSPLLPMDLCCIDYRDTAQREYAKSTTNQQM